MTLLGTQLSGERWKAWRGGAGCCGLVGIIRKLIVMKRLHRAVYSAVHMARGYNIHMQYAPVIFIIYLEYLVIFNIECRSVVN